jgi:hypothetical protein
VFHTTIALLRFSCPQKLNSLTGVYHTRDRAGGVINLHINDWMKVNGMSNDFEGCGGEDDDLYIRLKRTGLLHGPEKPGSTAPS